MLIRLQSIDAWWALRLCKGKNRVNIGAFKIGILLKDRFPRLTGRQQAQNIRHSNAHPANAWVAMHAVGVYGYPRQKI